MKKLLAAALLVALLPISGRADTVASPAANPAASRVLRVARDGFTLHNSSATRVALKLGRETLNPHPLAPSMWTMKIATKW